ncbi:hypothetical protein AAGW05_03025 [Arthrobacter sp. LAPM80]|uniref:hypothetical protein n=1 Tax=Arthrobacter sp. LAPM80 TaxID=3141788 RepID=UPI00398B30E6
MGKHPEFDDDDLIHEPSRRDPLAEVYSEMVTPDIEEINEHAKTLAQESESEPDQL